MTLTIRNLSKTYPNGVRALDDVSLNIPLGMFGLLGPNGAGKSTLMRTLATLQDPDAGSIHLGDRNLLTQKHEVRRTLGYLPQEFGFYPKAKARAMLEHFAVLKGLIDKQARRKRVDYLLDKVNLSDASKRQLGTFSGGMKQRFGIAVTLLSDPSLIIVDEPTAGLDPAERNRFHNLLSEIGEEVVIILSTHIVEDVRDLCPRMAILDKGRILVEDEPGALIAEKRGKVWEKQVTHGELAQHASTHRVISSRLFLGLPVIRVLADCDPGPGFSMATPTLEDVYFCMLQESKNQSIAA